MEEIATNIDILKTIFNYLQLNEQIKISEVCAEFLYVLVNCMWRYKYRQIKVYKLNGNSVVLNINNNYKSDHDNEKEKGICDLINEHFVYLTNKEFQKFLKLNQENILELELSDYRSDDLAEYKEIIINNEWNFYNLTKLCLSYVTIDSHQLKMIYRNCKNLRSLQLKQCCNFKADLITLSDLNNCDYDILLKIIKILKEFHIDYREMQFSDCSLNLHDLLIDDNLITLNLNVPLKNLRYKETPRLRDNSCENLLIGNFNEYKTLQKFSRLYLKTFQNLCQLTLEGSLNKIFLDSLFIQNLTDSCPLLKSLNLKRCLINVHNFNLLSSISQINLNNCMSLTWHNLKQLLSLPLLQEFHSIYSTYTREFENIVLPPHLHSLTLVGNEFRFSQIFESPSDSLLNLKQLIYFDGSETKISDISIKFPNLEIFHILPHHVRNEDLFRLKNLHIFKIPKYQNCYSNVSQLMDLIKLPNLRELSLTAVCESLAAEENSLDRFKVKRINLNYLELNFDLFNYLYEYLFDLLKFNLKLKIIVISEDVADFEYYMKLVKNRKFCREYIKLCGFQIDCKDFISQPEKVQQKIELIKEIAEFKNVYFTI
ncbi:uncharacterized protein ACRADG_000142 [Cochliomyia hominivorax]